MIQITSEYVPSLSENLTISSFDNASYLVCIDQEEPLKLKISPGTKLLIEQIDGKKKVEEITNDFNKLSGSKLPVETIITIINNQLLGYGFLQDDMQEKIKIKDDYLKLRVNLFSKDLVKTVVGRLLFLFDKITFNYIFLACSIFLAATFLLHFNGKQLYSNISVAFTGWFIGLNTLSILFHELGHAGACERFGAKTGAIGFGFYLLTPVFYTDVSDAWRLKRNERLIIVDLSGIYMQLIFCTIMACIFYLSGNQFWLNIAFLISISIIITLNPFFRYDGYWAMTDLLNVPNLREKSNSSLKEFLKWLIQKQSSWTLSWTNAFLVIYAMISAFIIAYFLFLLIFYNRDSVIYFPYNVLSFLKKIITDFNTTSFIWVRDKLTGFIIPFLFYFLLYKVLKKKVAQLLKAKS